MTFTETPATIAFYFSIVFGLTGLANLPFDCVGHDGPLLPWLVVAGILGGLAHIAFDEAVLRIQ